MFKQAIEAHEQLMDGWLLGCPSEAGKHEGLG